MLLLSGMTENKLKLTKTSCVEEVMTVNNNVRPLHIIKGMHHVKKNRSEPRNLQIAFDIDSFSQFSCVTKDVQNMNIFNKKIAAVICSTSYIKEEKRKWSTHLCTAKYFYAALSSFHRHAYQLKTHLPLASLVVFFMNTKIFWALRWEFLV